MWQVTKQKCVVHVHVLCELKTVCSRVGMAGMKFSGKAWIEYTVIREGWVLKGE